MVFDTLKETLSYHFIACSITGSPAADNYEDSNCNDEDYPCSSWTNDERELLLDTGVIFLYRWKTENQGMWLFSK